MALAPGMGDTTQCVGVGMTASVSRLSSQHGETAASLVKTARLYHRTIFAALHQAIEHPPPPLQLHLAPSERQGAQRIELRHQRHVLCRPLFPHLRPRQQQLQPSHEHLERGGRAHGRQPRGNGAQLQQEGVVVPLLEQRRDPHLQGVQGRGEEGGFAPCCCIHVHICCGAYARHSSKHNRVDYKLDDIITWHNMAIPCASRARGGSGAPTTAAVRLQWSKCPSIAARSTSPSAT